MTAYNPTNVRAELKALLQTQTTVVASANVHDFYNPNINGYPAIIFDISQEDASMLDDANNLRVMTFTLYIITEIKVAGLSEAKDILDVAVRTIINTLELKSNATLNGSVDWVMPVMGRRSEISSPEGSLLSQEMVVRCNIASTIL